MRLNSENALLKGYIFHGVLTRQFTVKGKNWESFLPILSLKAVNYDIENTVFSYIPNTAESAFYGLIKGVEDYINQSKMDTIIKRRGTLTREALEKIISQRPRVEKIAVKDAKLRTFITEDAGRDDLVGHVYDVTYGVIRRGIDNLVVIDDSIVSGTTLKMSIIRILDKLDPKEDCYSFIIASAEVSRLLWDRHGKTG